MCDKNGDKNDANYAKASVFYNYVSFLYVDQKYDRKVSVLLFKAGDLH